MNETGNFADGKRFAYYDMLSVAVEQAGLLGIPTAKIGMTDFDPDRELLTAPYKKAA